MSVVEIAREEARRELDARKIQEESEQLAADFKAFVLAAWPHIKKAEEYKHNWHIDAICEHLVGVTHKDIMRLQVWVPPQSMKSLLVSVLWPAWEWTHSPWIRYWGASYETRLAGRLSALSRNLMLSEWYQARWGDQFTWVRDAEHYFENSIGGTRLATSPESTGTGEHGHRILIDDPISAQEAEATSKANLRHVNEVWYDGTVATRGIGDDHARIIIMQRLHEEDLAAHALTLEDWTVLCLPERFWEHPFAWRGKRGDLEKSRGSTFGAGDPREQMHYDHGDLLWPRYRPPEISDAIGRSLKHRQSGQQQQWPAPKEGNLLKRHWWRFYDPNLFNEDLPPRELKAMRARRPRCSIVVQSVDTPLRDSEQNDMVSIQAWGVKGADRYLLDIRTEHMSSPQAKRAIIEQAKYVRKLYPRCRHKVLIENAGYGPDIIPDLKRVLTGVEKISPSKDGSKYMRADAASDALEDGNCWLPGVGGGTDETMGPARVVPKKIKEFIDSCAIFDNGAHDDDVDAWSQCMNWLRKRITRPGRTSSPFSS